jgi:hypothetical protein
MLLNVCIYVYVYVCTYICINVCTVRSVDEETAFERDIGCDISPPLLSPSPLARVQSLADSLTSISVLAHIYKNTVKR